MSDFVSDTDWVSRAANLQAPTTLFIDGAEQPAHSGAIRSIIAPRNGQPIVDLAWADESDADAAVAAARRAFDAGPWPRMKAAERGQILQSFARVLEEHREEIALLIALEMGKPIRDCYETECRALVGCVQFYGELADKMSGEIVPTAEDQVGMVTREPRGVVAAVVPWNFPLTIGSWKFAAALAAGCTVVMKTAEQSPLSMQLVARLGVEAGLPPGVLNVLSGDGTVVGRALGLHQDVDALSFTGSTAVGRHFLRYSADSNLKRVQLELGGKSPNIIFDDAPDLDAAADKAAWAIFFNSGEMCTAGSRLVVHESIADRVIERVAANAADWFPDDPLLPDTRMGPLVDARSLERVLDQLDAGVSTGGRVVTGGERVRVESGGAYLAPTVVDGLAPDNVLVQEELFAPVLAVQRFSDEDEALRLAGDTPYGLAAGVWTSDLGRAHRMAKQLKAGTVWVNCYEDSDITAPFGGMKLSGFGRDRSAHALDEYTDLKTTWIQH